MAGRSLCLVARSVRESSRSWSTYVLRALLLLGLGLGVFAAHDAVGSTSLGGPRLLTVIAWANWILLTVVGVGWFSAMVSEERESETLGLLRMAGFSPLGILFGKGAGSLVSLALLALVQIPFGVFTITLGGVPAGQVTEIFLILLAHGLLVFSLAALGSVLGTTSARASALTLSMLLAVHIIPMAGRLAILIKMRGTAAAAGTGASAGTWLASLQEFVESWFAYTPVVALVQSTGNRMAFATSVSEEVLIRNAWISAMVFGLAVALFHVMKHEAVAHKPQTWRALLSPGSRIGARFGDNPIRQKEFYTVVGGWAGLWFRCFAYFGLMVLAYWLLRDSGSRNRAMASLTFGFGLMILVLEVAVIAEKLFRTEIDGKTWGAMYGLPVGLGAVVRAKIEGAVFGVLPVCACLLAGFLFDPRGIQRDIEQVFSEPGFWFLLSQIVFGILLTAYFSLRSARGAFARALGLIFGFDFLLAVVVRRGNPDTLFGVLAMLFAVGCVSLTSRIAGELRRQAAA